MELKLRAIGNSVGVVLPREVLGRLKVSEDGVLLTSLDPKVTEQLRIGRDIMRRYRNTLRALAQ